MVFTSTCTQFERPKSYVPFMDLGVVCNRPIVFQQGVTGDYSSWDARMISGLVTSKPRWGAKDDDVALGYLIQTYVIT